jgi:hypothetical protein
MVGAKLPERHADHGAYSWRDYFKVNTDHKVIGIQYLRSWRWAPVARPDSLVPALPPWPTYRGCE